MSVYIDAGPVIASVVGAATAGVTALYHHSKRREERQSDALENVRTDIKAEVQQSVSTIGTLTAVVNDVRVDVAYLKGFRKGEESASR